MFVWIFFFFKQKTAYEMRISDWSSDVCSSALADTTVIHAGSVITDAAAEPSGPATITVTDGRIVKIVEGFQPTPEGAIMIHLPDHTVLPAMIDQPPHPSGPTTGELCPAAVEPTRKNCVWGERGQDR